MTIGFDPMLVALNRQLRSIHESSVTLLTLNQQIQESSVYTYTQLTIAFDLGVQCYLQSIDSNVRSMSSVLLVLSSVQYTTSLLLNREGEKR